MSGSVLDTNTSNFNRKDRLQKGRRTQRGPERPKGTEITLRLCEKGGYKKRKPRIYFIGK